MDSIKDLIFYFRDPRKVAKFQKIFGVYYSDESVVKSVNLSEVIYDENPLEHRRTSVQRPENYYVDESLTLNKEKLVQENNGPSTNLDQTLSTTNKDYKKYTISNKFWFYLFYFGTYLGDQIGYTIVLPFWIWNVDANVGRKLVLVWTIVMYVGQCMKDIIQWPRPPCPPVIRLQSKWALEYGMPSTHAMMGVAFPSCLVYYSLPRFKFPLIFGIIASIIWCGLISISRIYLGMHSILDVLVGLFLSGIMVMPLLPAMDFLDNFFIVVDWYPLGLITISIFLILVYPKMRSLTTLGDTTSILATCVGIQCGSWFNLKFINSNNPKILLYTTSLPILEAFGFGALRLVLGLFCIVVSFLIFEVTFKIFDSGLEKLNVTVKVKDGQVFRRTSFLYLFYKYLSIAVTAFHVTCSIPYLFSRLKIDPKL